MCQVKLALNLAELNKSERASPFVATQNLFECLLCSEKIDISTETKTYLNHLLTVHYLLISDAEKIGDLEQYINYWRERLKTNLALDDICFKIKTNTGKHDIGIIYKTRFKKKRFFLFCLR